MKDRGMKFIITPIAFWGNGWPEPDEKTPGFSTKFGKDACLVNPEAIKAQENYLYQFLNHVNTYTGLAYKDDPDVIAFEICNEPHHREGPEAVTAFIKRMADSMRRTGCGKPVLYNVTHSIHLADAYANAGIQGGTYQWYPTGLGTRHELRGNWLLNVEQYPIPFAANPSYKKMAKIVYEFDAADVGRSYIYPAMARSFREAGMQIATHFAYDPTYMAYANTEYGTHYMNLAYAPQKALSLKIASEVFHTVPMYKKFGHYPGNTTFDAFRVSYEQDLAEMATANKFIYTNNTTTVPPGLSTLDEVAGFGNSPVVQYEGLGAYFLDRLEAGVWRLEVMPDAVWVRDPFEPYSSKKEVAVINWRSWPMRINLPDLGDDFYLQALNDGNHLEGQAKGKTLAVSPGTYLLLKNGTTTRFKKTDRRHNIMLKEFVAPAATLKKTYFLHTPLPEITAGSACRIEATVASPNAPEAVELWVVGSHRWENIKMEKVSGYTYAADLPKHLSGAGFIPYYIVVRSGGHYNTYPSGIEGRPGEWDFYDSQPYQLRFVSASSPVYLFEAATDAEQLDRPWLEGSGLQPVAGPEKAELLINGKQFSMKPDPENPNAEPQRNYPLRCFIGDKIASHTAGLADKKQLVFHGRALNDRPCTVQLILIMKDGSAYGGSLTINTSTGDYRLPLTGLKKTKAVSLPRPYPTFLPYYVDLPAAGKFDLKEVERLEFSVGPGLPDDPHGVAIQHVRIE